LAAGCVEAVAIGSAGFHAGDRIILIHRDLLRRAGIVQCRILLIIFLKR